MKDINYMYKYILTGVFFILILITSFSIAEAKEKESYYQKTWCMHKIEYVLPDKTRIDCLTPDYAIEFDFAHKWAEAVGQAIHYGLQTDRRPGIVLIITKQTDMKYWERMQKIIWYYRLPIQTWMIKDLEILPIR